MLKNLATATMLLFLMQSLTGCTTTSSKPRNDCRQYVKTYGDAIECMIQLDNLQ